MNTALLLSGGIGSRIHSEVPKQYIRIGDRMLFTYALETLAESPYIDRILIVAAEEWREAIADDAERNVLSWNKVAGFVSPGFNRQSSVINGMKELLRQSASSLLMSQGREIYEPSEPFSDCGEQNAEGLISDSDTVLIHDAARPLLSQKQLSDCFEALSGHDGVMPVLPMKDTVYLSGDGKTVSKLLERSRIFAGQAPELFLLKKYYYANTSLSPERLAAINGSTEPAVLAGMDIVMIPGDENNFKITTQQDLERFRSAVCINESEYSPHQN